MAKIIRTKTKASGGVTSDELKAMKVHTDKWINNTMRTIPIDPEKIIPAIEGLYKVSGLKSPRVVIVPSPLVMAYAFGAAAEIWNKRKATDQATDQATREATDQATHQATFEATDRATDQATLQATFEATDQATRQATDQATHQATRQATRQATYQATEQATYEATDNDTLQATYEATYEATRAASREATIQATIQVKLPHVQQAISACFELSGKNGINHAKNWYSCYQGGNMWSSYDCYLTACRDILGLDLPAYKKYHFWEQAALHGGFRVMHEEFCMVSDFPEYIKIDDQNRPHCENGPSHGWRDGWSLYHWHGVVVPEEWILDRSSLTPVIALSQTNIELRRIACEMLGWAKILNELDHKTIDSHPDPMIGDLIEVLLPDAGASRFLRVLCGTNREFAIPVPLEMKRAREAQAWTWGETDATFINPEIRT